MSSPAVVTYIEDQVKLFLPAVPFYRTANEVPKWPFKPGIWSTLIPVASNETSKTVGCQPNLYREDGTIAVGLLCKSGSGRHDPSVLLEQVRDGMRGQVGLDGFFRVMSVTPPQDDTRGETKGDSYLMTIDVNYQFDFYA